MGLSILVSERKHVKNLIRLHGQFCLAVILSLLTVSQAKGEHDRDMILNALPVLCAQEVHICLHGFKSLNHPLITLTTLMSGCKITFNSGIKSMASM